MKILIVGGAGYIGSHIVLEAINQGYKVTVFDDLSTGFKENIHPSADFFIGSTLFEKDLAKVMKNNRNSLYRSMEPQQNKQVKKGQE